MENNFRKSEGCIIRGNVGNLPGTYVEEGSSEYVDLAQAENDQTFGNLGYPEGGEICFISLDRLEYSNFGTCVSSNFLGEIRDSLQEQSNSAKS